MAITEAALQSQTIRVIPRPRHLEYLGCVAVPPCVCTKSSAISEIVDVMQPRNAIFSMLGARLRGRTATQRSRKGSKNVLGRVLKKGSQQGSEKGVCYGLCTKQGF